MVVLPLVIAVELLLRLPTGISIPVSHSTMPPPVSAATPPNIADAVLDELNRARTDPAGFSRSLQDVRRYYRGNLLARPGAGATFLTREGVAPVDEAIAFVNHAAVRPPLSLATLLAAAAADHQADQSRDGRVGHAGSDGSTPGQRARRHGGDAWIGEVIAYGSTDPTDIVRQLIVDDGVADRSHRRLLFDASLRFAGISCGSHPVYRYMCVVTVGRTPDGRPLHRQS